MSAQMKNQAPVELKKQRGSDKSVLGRSSSFGETKTDDVEIISSPPKINSNALVPFEYQTDDPNLPQISQLLPFKETPEKALDKEFTKLELETSIDRKSSIDELSEQVANQPVRYPLKTLSYYLPGTYDAALERSQRLKDEYETFYQTQIKFSLALREQTLERVSNSSFSQITKNWRTGWVSIFNEFENLTNFDSKNAIDFVQQTKIDQIIKKFPEFQQEKVRQKILSLAELQLEKTNLVFHSLVEQVKGQDDIEFINFKNQFQEVSTRTRSTPFLFSLNELVNIGSKALDQASADFQKDDIPVLFALQNSQKMGAKTADSYKRIIVELSEIPGTFFYNQNYQDFKNMPISELLEQDNYKFAVSQAIRNKASNLKTSRSIFESIRKELQEYQQFSEKLSEFSLKVLQELGLAEVNVNSVSEQEITLISLISYYYNPGYTGGVGVFQNLLESQVQALLNVAAKTNPYVDEITRSAVEGQFVEGFFKNCLQDFDL